MVGFQNIVQMAYHSNKLQYDIVVEQKIYIVRWTSPFTLYIAISRYTCEGDRHQHAVKINWNIAFFSKIKCKNLCVCHALTMSGYQGGYLNTGHPRNPPSTCLNAMQQSYVIVILAL